jgi:phytoene synthase
MDAQARFASDGGGMTASARAAPDDLPPDLAAHAATTLAHGSTSFAAAARLLPAGARDSAALLYAWCRHCDDVIDGQSLGHGARPVAEGAAERLAAIEAATRAALAGSPPPVPAFRALALVARRHGLPAELPLAHLDGFRLDVAGRRYESLDDLLAYCWGVAGVVGVMMARIMGVSDRDTLDRAADLGLAFQLTNIARDVAEDAAVGRIYLPLRWLAEAGVPPSAIAATEHRDAVARLRARLVTEAEPFYDSALVGIGRLPPRQAAAIGAARSVYRAIGRKLVRGRVGWGERAATGRAEKAALVLAGVSAALAARMLVHRPRDPALWRQRTGPERG